jgi:TonB family protein
MRGLIGLLVLVAGLATSFSAYADDAASEVAALNKKAVDELSKGEPRAASGTLEEALQLAGKTIGPKAEQTDAVALNLARVYLLTGNNEKAIPLFKRVVNDYADHYGHDDQRVGVIYYEMGRAYLPLAKWQEATKASLLAAGILKKAKVPDERYIRALDQVCYANIEDSHGRAMRNCQDAIGQSEAIFGKDAAITGEAHYSMGRLHVAYGNYKGAETELETALGIFTARLAPTDPNLLAAHAALVPVYEALGESEKATAHVMTLAELAPDAEGNPQPLYKAAPEFPARMAWRGQKDSVTLHYTITTDGHVDNISVVDGDPDSDFAKASIKAVRQWRYKPRIVNGIPVTSEASYQITFRTQPEVATGSHIPK